MASLPSESRARGTAISYSGGSLGALLTPILITPITIIAGWRGGFLFTGLIGLLWLMWWLWLSRDPAIRARPREISQTAGINFRDARLCGCVSDCELGDMASDELAKAA